MMDERDSSQVKKHVNTVISAVKKKYGRIRGLRTLSN